MACVEHDIDTVLAAWNAMYTVAIEDGLLCSMPILYFSNLLVSANGLHPSLGQSKTAAEPRQ